LSNPSIANPVASPSVTTTYTVAGTSQCATGVGIDSVTVIIPIVPALGVNGGGDQEICVGSQYNLNAASSGGYGSNIYSWFLYSGPSMDSIYNANTSGAYVMPTAPGVNTYVIDVTDACGLTTSDTVVVDVLLDCNLEVPNIFTPNGDGQNDFFTIDATGIKTFSIVIYNRWGTRVFESDDINKSWDGNNVVDGTYFYIIRAESINGKEYNPTGYVQRLKGN